MEKSDVPGADSVRPGKFDDGRPSTHPGYGADAVPLGTDDLTWSEVADAVWLTTVTQNTWRQRTAPVRTTHDTAQPPAGAEAPGDHSGELGLQTNEAPHPLTTGLGTVTQATVPVLGTVAQAPIFTDAADIVRALRPLKRKVTSWQEEAVILDEDTTAERAAEDGLWLPMTKQDTERWLDLTLVIDNSPSMALWQSTVTSVVSLVERLGTFRSVQIHLLDTHGTPAGSPATPVLRGGTLDTPSRSPAELLDSSGRRILLVLTDCVGQCWREELISPLLAHWASAMPVAVVHLLPQRLWARGGLALHRTRLKVPGPLRPNRLWSLELSDAWLEPDPDAAMPAGIVPVPVLELGARMLGWWARFISGSNRDPTDALVLLTSRDQRERTPLQRATHDLNDSPGGQLSAQNQVMNFFSVASPAACRLATLLAAVPVSLPVARLVQAELVPESRPDHLAEVLTSGLLRPPVTVATERAWDTGTFHFTDAVRSVLLSGVRRADTARVVRLVTQHFGDQISSLRRFRDALEDPDSTPDPEFTADTAHLVTIERTVMRALSGPYLSRAGRLHSRECDLPPIGPATVSLSGAPMSDADTLESVTDRTDLKSKLDALSTPVSDSPASDVEPSVRASAVDIPTSPRPSSLTEFASTFLRESQAVGVPPIWGNVPARNPNFTGRVELLDQLGERLTAGGATAVLPAALHGMGGIGKTQMSVEYIYRHLADYDIVWWIQATHEAQVRAGLTELAERLGLPGSSEAHTAVPAVLEALRVGRPFHRWLLVFDSAESPNAVRQFFPTNGPGQILVTSRNPEWAGIARPLEVAVFSREESTELLRRRDPAINDEEADRLADALGDLPLAIAQAAAWRAETGMPVAEYLRLFEEKVAEILDTEGPIGYEISVAAAWNVSLDELRTLNPAAHQLLQVCAFFGAEPISRELFRTGRNAPIAPDLDDALRDPIRLGRTIRDINRYGLAKIDHRNNTLQLHRLVQLVLSNRMTAQRRAEMSHGAHLLLANFDPNDPIPPEQWPRYQGVLPHAYASKVIECEDPWVRNLVTNLMHALYFWGDHEEAARLARQAVDMWTEKLGPTNDQTLLAAQRLGFYLWTLGRYAEAAELNQKTVELHRQISGENSEETVIAELAVVTDLKGRGDFIAALELNEQVYRKAKGLFGDDDPTTLTTANDLVVSLELAGDYSGAQKLAEETYRRRVDVLGHDHQRTTNTLMGLILARREAGDYAGARIENETLAERSRKLFGGDKALTLRRSHQLAVARRKDGDNQDALGLSGQVLEQFQVRYGSSHPDTMASALAQSISLRHAGELGPARKLGGQTVELYRRGLGEHHPYTLAARVDLAVTMRLLGDVAGARQLDERSLEQFRVSLGPDHPYAIVSAINLASDLAALGETEAALELGTEALNRATRVLGADHPTTLAAGMNCVLDLRTLGRTQEAETRYSDVLTRYRHTLRDTHPITMAAARGSRVDCDIDPLPL